MQNNLTLSNLVPTIKEVVENGGEATFKPEGISMKPMLIGGRDEIVLIKPTLPLKKYDLPLYLRDNGTAVLHRVVDLDQQGYIMRGDNTWSNEKGISDKDIVAMVSRFRRGKKWYSTENKAYRIYAIFWVGSFPVRKFFRKGIRKIIRIIKNKGL